MKNKFIRNYLSFSRNERRGIIILCSLITLCWIVPEVVRQFKRSKKEDFTDFEKEVDLFRSQQDAMNLAHAKPKEIEKVFNVNELPDPFPFDPNTLSVANWQKLGMPFHVTQTIKHYLAAGGHFFQKEDLKKIYGLPEGMYKHLKPYIHIQRKSAKKIIKNVSSKATATETASLEPQQKTVTKNNRTTTTRQKLVIDINKADSARWIKLKGIGQVLSGRIMHFKRALGGFYAIEQIAEVYGLPDSTFQNIKQQLKISDIHLKKLNINKATVDELKSHPYVDYRLADAIKAFREEHGAFNSIEGLKQLQLVNDQIYRKLVPYLTVK